jgi:hypothetical protein
MNELEQLRLELSHLQTAIRKHRDQQGDDRCAQDDYELYAALPEGLPEGYRVRLNEPEQMLNDCVRFVFHRHDKACPYLSPQREIEHLKQELADCDAVVRLLSSQDPNEPGAPVRIHYKNWKHEFGDRHIRPLHLWFGSTEWHPEPQWFLKAWDLDKDVERDFAMRDIHAWSQPGKETP